MNSTNKNIGGKHEFKRGYQPRSNLVKDENVDLLANSYNTLNLWHGYGSQLLNIYNVSDVRQIEIHTFHFISFYCNSTDPTGVKPSDIEHVIHI
jgi:hypothetical protein